MTSSQVIRPIAALANMTVLNAASYETPAPASVEVTERKGIRRLKKWQRAGYRALAEERLRRIKAPTGSGKSMLAMALALHDYVCGHRIIIAVPKNDVAKNFGPKPFKIRLPGRKMPLAWKVSDPKPNDKVEDVKNFILRPRAGQANRIMVCTHAALVAAWLELGPEGWSQGEKVSLILDECHHVSYNQVGDDEATNGLGDVVEDYILRGSGTLTMVTATWMRREDRILPDDKLQDFVTYEYQIEDYLRSLRYLRKINFNFVLSDDPVRAQAQILASAPDRETIRYLPPTVSLPPTPSFPHGDKYAYYSQCQEADREAGWVGTDLDLINEGAVSGKSRDGRLRDFERLLDSGGPTPKLITAMYMYREGADWPACSRVIMMAPSDSYVQTLQTNGRGFRDYPVVIRSDGVAYPNEDVAAEALGVDVDAIRRVLNGKSPNCKGFGFRPYKDTFDSYTIIPTTTDPDQASNHLKIVLASMVAEWTFKASSILGRKEVEKRRRRVGRATVLSHELMQEVVDSIRKAGIYSDTDDAWAPAVEAGLDAVADRCPELADLRIRALARAEVEACFEKVIRPKVNRGLSSRSVMDASDIPIDIKLEEGRFGWLRTWYCTIDTEGDLLKKARENLRGGWTMEKIERLVRDYFAKRGEWPNQRSGIIEGDGRVWAVVDAWLRRNGSSLHDLCVRLGKLFQSSAEKKRKILEICVPRGYGLDESTPDERVLMEAVGRYRLRSSQTFDADFLKVYDALPTAEEKRVADNKRRFLEKGLTSLDDRDRAVARSYMSPSQNVYDPVFTAEMRKYLTHFRLSWVVLVERALSAGQKILEDQSGPIPKQVRLECIAKSHVEFKKPRDVGRRGCGECRNRRAVIRSDGITYRSIREAADTLNVTPAAIRNAMRKNAVHELRKCKGFSFWYAEPIESVEKTTR